MKGEKLLAVTLAALMTASSVGVSAFAEETASAKAEQGEILVQKNNNEENGVALFGANMLDSVELSYVRVNANSENTAKGFSCNFNLGTMPNLTADWKFELKCGDKLLSTTTVKSTSSHLNNKVGTAFICWTGDNGESGTWSTEMNAENITTADKPNKLVMYVGEESKEFDFVLDEIGGEAFTSLSNVEDPTAVNDITLESAITSTNSERTIEGFSVSFNNIKLSNSLEIELCYNDTVLSTTTVKETSQYYNQKGNFSCLIGWGGNVNSSNHWSTELNANAVRTLGADTLPNKIVVKQAGTSKTFDLDSSNFINAVADAYENFAVFRTPTVGTVEWVPNYKTDSQAVSISMGNIGRVHNDMKIEILHDDTILATSTPKDNIQGLETDGLSAIVVCDGRFTEASSSWTSELNVNNWNRMKPNKVKITNNGVETICNITTEQGNYDGLKVASKMLSVVDVQAENNMTDSEYPGKSAQALLITLGNVGYVGESMTVDLYHDDIFLSSTKAKQKRLEQNYNGLGVTVILDGDAEVSGSWETTTVERDKWSLDTAPNKAKITIDGEEQWVDINQIGAYGKFVKFSIFGRSINVSADTEAVKADETVTITVNLNGKNLTNAVYDLNYESDKFEFVSASTGTVPNNGTISEMLYKTEAGDEACFDDGETLATYVFKAIAQTEEVTADFGIGNTAASTYVESIDATKVATANNEKVSVTIELKEYEIETKIDGEVVEGETLNVPYTNAGHTFTVEATPSASVSYKVNGGEATNSVSITEKGTYTIEYTITPANGYAEVTGTFTLVIGDPEYVVEVNTATENSDYVAGKKLVLVYTNTDGLAFKYGNDIMIDVTSRGYKYNNDVEYGHVYAFVTDAIANAEVDGYKENISCVIPSPENLIALTYSTDLNFDNDLTVQDISVAYGIYNVNKDYFKNVKYQKNILRADTDGDKDVDNDDANAVVNAVKNK